MDRRLTTILAADMVGYSRLMAADEEGVIARLRALRADLIDPAIAAAGGRIVKTMGDGLLAEFPSPLAATRMAVAVQDAMRAEEAARPEADRFRFRIGVNTGEIVVDGDDVLGDAVNIAARLESLAPPGGICIGRTAHDQISGRIDAPLTALGPQMVKNIPDPVEVWRVEIEGVAPPPAKRAERPSIAVLPFDNMSADPDQAFLADGIVEDVITELSRFRSLLVIARNSTFAYKGAARDVREIAKELDVRYVVEGSVRRAGDRVRVTAQLIEAEAGAHIWADRWDRTMEDLFDLQDELTQAIITAVTPEIGAHELTLARRKPTESLNAWELSQRALHEFYAYTPASVATAKALALRAAATDPDMAAPCVLLARIFIYEYLESQVEGLDALGREGLAWAERAMAIDRRNDDALFALGFVQSVTGRNREAITTFERGVAINQNNASIRAHLAITLLAPEVQRPAEAIEHIDAALRLNPADPFAWAQRMIRVMAHIQAGDSVDMAAELDIARATPGVDWKPFILGALWEASERREESAAKALNEALARKPDLSLNIALRALGQIFLLPRFAEPVERLVALGLPRE